MEIIRARRALHVGGGRPEKGDILDRVLANLDVSAGCRFLFFSLSLSALRFSMFLPVRWVKWEGQWA